MFDQSHAQKPAYVQFMKRPPLAAVVRIPTNSSDTYKEPSGREREIIYEIITTVARTGWIHLGIKKEHIENLGAQIGHLHPLIFLGVIFSHVELKDCMIDIFNSSLKRSRFMHGGLTSNLDREARKKNLKNHLDDFAEKVRAPKEKLLEFFERGEQDLDKNIDSKKWEEMVEYLIHV